MATDRRTRGRAAQADAPADTWATALQVARPSRSPKDTWSGVFADEGLLGLYRQSGIGDSRAAYRRTVAGATTPAGGLPPARPVQQPSGGLTDLVSMLRVEVAELRAAVRELKAERAAAQEQLEAWDGLRGRVLAHTEFESWDDLERSVAAEVEEAPSPIDGLFAGMTDEEWDRLAGRE